MHGTWRWLRLPLVIVSLFPGPAFAALDVSLQLAPSSPQPVATPVTLSVIADGGPAGPLAYQFSYRGVGGNWRLLRDFNSPATAEWIVLDEGDYELRVVALSPSTGESGADTVPFTITSPVTTSAVVGATRHPLVALYSRPACSGGWVWVRFRPSNGSFWTRTTAKPCQLKSVSLYVAGMRPETDYWVQEERLTADVRLERGALLPFRTGAAQVPVEQPWIVDPPDAATSWSETVLLTSYLRNAEVSVATDIGGNLLWYYPDLGSVVLRPVPGGTMLVRRRQVHDGQLLREVDLAGNVLTETNALRVSTLLKARGQDPITSFHHEALRLPNGHTVVIGSVERTLNDVQGPGPMNVYGEMILDLDPNFQLVWAWNAFDHLDASRLAVLGETCTSEGPGCPPLAKSAIANDWLHANSLWYVPEDGSLVMSLRHQDWVIKIDYGDGHGSGRVLWRLGKDGDFTTPSSDPWPWFSHQHDARQVGDLLLVYDNGNTRVEGPQGIGGNSRGQVWRLDEEAMTAALLHNFDLGDYAFGLGSAQSLGNGNYHFLSGIIGDRGAPEAQSTEVTPAGGRVFALRSTGAVYRSFRMKSLYKP